MVRRARAQDSRPRRWGARLVASGLVLLAGATSAAGQGARVTGVTTSQYISIRPIVPDSVSAAEVPGTGELRRTADGTPVSCRAGDAYCRFYRSADRASTVPIIQDVHVNAWGFGQGVRFHAQLRGRHAFGRADGLWPRADDAFDALAVYLELDRERFRLRGGRQWRASGLGFYNYDGASVLVRPRRDLSVDLYAGRGLTRGLNEPRTSGALEAIEPLAPDDAAYLLGVEARWRPAAGAAFGAVYQREIRTDRAGLYSERFALDGRAALSRATLTGSLQVDVALEEVNEALLRADAPLGRGLGASIEVRRYRPYFELWTIWGAFSPAGHREVLAGLNWNLGELDLDLRGGWRQYDETGKGLSFAPIRDDGWRAMAAAAWRPAPDWLLEAGYRADIGFGAARSEGDVGVRRELGESGYVAFRGLAFQRIYEFRVDDGVVLGAGADAGLRIGPELTVAGSLYAYRHRDGTGANDVDWTQLRGTLRLLWAVGRDPGLRGAGVGR